MSSLQPPDSAAAEARRSQTATPAARGSTAPSAGSGARPRTGTPGKRQARSAAPVAAAPVFSHKEFELLQACDDGDIDKVYKLLWDGARVNCRMPGVGSTPLMVACKQGHTKVAAVLIEFGALVKSSDDYAATALHWAANSGDPALVSLVVSKGHLSAADLSKRDTFGSTPLHFASVRNLAGSVQALISAGLDPTSVNNDGRKASDLTTDDTIRAFLQDEEAKAARLAAMRNKRNEEAAGDAQPQSNSKSKKSKKGKSAKSKTKISASSSALKQSRSAGASRNLAGDAAEPRGATRSTAALSVAQSSQRLTSTSSSSLSRARSVRPGSTAASTGAPGASRTTSSQGVAAGAARDANPAGGETSKSSRNGSRTLPSSGAGSTRQIRKADSPNTSDSSLSRGKPPKPNALKGFVAAGPSAPRRL
ncbi:hypothetical protein HK105_201864 [Polyrhizophydium stewartii]|uniref:Ankyrin repeat protein n=1 Tax=Polyrhizophydium stewartii TaxID=2732419 RepID=A0ABR4NG02_9FUNG